MPSPTVSVIVPMYNRKATVGDAIASLRAQTLRDIEIVVVDDGSTDGSVQLVEAIDDPRIRLVRHATNQGIPAARNTGLNAARGRFIAWLDSDDIARPERLARQAAFLAERNDVAMVGSWAGRIGLDGRRKRGTRVNPIDPETIAPALLFRSCFQQSSVFGRAGVLKSEPYRLDFPVCEDLDVFLRLARNHRLANLPEALVDRRQHDGQAVQRHAALIRERKAALYGPLLAELGMSPTAQDLDRHVTIGNPRRVALEKDILVWADDWLTQLIAANRNSGRYDTDGLALAVAIVWARLAQAGRTTNGVTGTAAALVSPLLRPLLRSGGRRWLSVALPATISAR